MITLEKIKNIAKKFTILYVEDDEDIASEMIKYLDRFFADVSYAKDGIEGLELYKKDKFDIVIADLAMPKMDGIEMISKIKAINEDQPVLITSVHDESEYMFNSIALGIDGYIIKPFDTEQLNHELFKISDKLNKYQENEKYKINLEKLVAEKTDALENMIKFEEENYEKTLLSIVDMIEDRDSYTAGHSKRVATYCEMIAKEMGYSEAECEMIYKAGILHDVGKITTPDAILLKPRKLNKLEYTLIQEHVNGSYKLLHNVPMFEELADIVGEHHERYDGKGYPSGISAESINHMSRIMIVADAFDAMTTNRVYKTRKSVDTALKELVDLKYKQFHPEVVDKAIVVLKDIKIDTWSSQIPKTKIEEARFAYFYKDSLTNLFNQDYLDIVLLENLISKNYKYINLFFINNFSSYNKKNGWEKGNILLRSFAAILDKHSTDSLVFRIFGDDFAILSKTKINLKAIETEINQLIKANDVTCKIKSENLKDILSTAQIEKI